MVKYYSHNWQSPFNTDNKLLTKMFNISNLSIETYGTQKKILFSKALNNVYLWFQFGKESSKYYLVSKTPSKRPQVMS